MFTKPDAIQTRDLARLSTEEFSHLWRFLELELNAISSRALDAKDIDVVRQLQGRGQLVTELLDLIRKAPSLMT